MHSRLAPPRDLFAGTAEHYIRYRSQYPHEALDEITCASLPLGGRVLDLGSGPGTIAIALAERGLDVTAVDPSPDMLVAGSREAERRGVHLDWIEGDSEHLPEVTGIATVTIGDAFHWMAPITSSSSRSTGWLSPPGSSRCSLAGPRARPARPGMPRSQRYRHATLTSIHRRLLTATTQGSKPTPFPS